tara:strand:+ start:84381 stop:84590 length:210 start_codon:yes stop_codon:yes gene_type:complete
MKKNICPICKNQAREKFMPFCSESCANRDLSNWLTGKYYIPGERINHDESMEHDEELILVNNKDTLDLS